MSYCLTESIDATGSTRSLYDYLLPSDEEERYVSELKGVSVRLQKRLDGAKTLYEVLKRRRPESDLVD